MLEIIQSNTTMLCKAMFSNSSDMCCHHEKMCKWQSTVISPNMIFSNHATDRSIKKVQNNFAKTKLNITKRLSSQSLLLSSYKKAKRIATVNS